ncbi:MAG: A24 family peptidase C-terminal domain-containing protein [Candidatus Bathyarchaeia archaeon]
MHQIFAIARTALCIAFFFYASWSDYKTREVSNKVWILLAPPAFILTIIDLFFDGNLEQLLLYGLCFGLTSAFAIILFYSGGFGGADSKALMCLALALPFYPEIFQPLTGTPSPISQIFFPITIFSNAVLFAAATAIYLLFYNIVWRWRTGKRLFEGYEEASLGKKILVMLTGYKISIDKLKSKWHIYPMENLEENTSKRTLLLTPKDEVREAIVQKLEKAVEERKIDNSFWATPGLPMLIFITVGLILALILDNIVWLCIRLLIG